MQDRPNNKQIRLKSLAKIRINRDKIKTASKFRYAFVFYYLGSYLPFFIFVPHQKHTTMRYEKSLMDQWDHYAIQKTAKQEGLVEGREEGEEKLKFELTARMLKAGKHTVKQIAELTGFSEAYIRKVKRSLP